MTGTLNNTDFEPDRPKARILIVDDDERNLLALETVLDDLAEVVTATSGEEALRLLLKYDFAAILLDVFMPILDGYETARIIRQREQSKRIPILFLSAVNKEAEHLRRGYEMGAVDYVFKPVEPLILRAKVAVFVDLHDKTREIHDKVMQERRLREENARVHEERLMAEQALRRAEQRQAIVLQSLPIVLYLEALDSSPRAPHYISGDFKALTGYDFEEAIGIADFWPGNVHPEDRERVVAERRALGRKDKLAIEYRWKDPEGSYRHLLEQAIVLRDAEGNRTEVAGTLLDVTSQRKLEAELAQAQKMDAVGKLTGGIAHDFNNLLAAVLSGLMLIEKQIALNERQKSIIDLTRRSAMQGAELIKRMLAFARKQELTASAISVDDLVQSLKGLLEHTLGGRVELDWQIGADMWSIFADQNQTELALMNLIINARDAMPEGGIVVIGTRNETVSRHESLENGDYVVVSVTDRGVGIKPEDLPQIFEPFYTTKDVGKGTGLGLSMVYGFAQQSGGAIFVKSKPDEGTSFELWLPKADDASTITICEETFEVPESAGLRLLLVDDHSAVRETTHALLAQLGHEVVSVASGEQALSLISDAQEQFDFLITDYAMPNMSGLELVQKIRKFMPECPAIIITGYADQSALDDRPDNVAIVTKPFDERALQKALVLAETTDP